MVRPVLATPHRESVQISLESSEAGQLRWSHNCPIVFSELSLMRIIATVLTSACLVVLLVATPIAAQTSETALPREHHGWGRFNEGSWKRVQIVSQTLDSAGKVMRRTTTETTSTLSEVSEDGYVLTVETVVNVAGKQLSSSKQVIRRGFFGQSEGQTAEVRRVGSGCVRIGDQEFPSEIRRVVVKGDGAEQVHTVYYSDSVSPYVLRREATVTDPANQTTNSKTQASAIAVNVPNKVLTEVKQTSLVKTVHRDVKGTAETVELHCPEVPGGVVQHVTKEYDLEGRLVRTDTLQLLSYGTVQSQMVSPTPRRRLFTRRGRR